jgi:hypothetical protein
VQFERVGAHANVAVVVVAAKVLPGEATRDDEPPSHADNPVARRSRRTPIKMRASTHA